MIAILEQRLWFPEPSASRDDGLLAIGGDLGPARLELAYRSGIFPWTAQPLTWWSPDPRAIFDLDRIHVPRSLERSLRKGRFEVTFDQAFFEVIQTCASVPRGGDGTWISPEFVVAYTRLFRRGRAHSAECWLDGKLVGGVYGVSFGAFFAGESMFHTETDASKIALVRLFERLRGLGFQLFDTQMTTPVTTRLGAFSIPRSEYLARLKAAVSGPNLW